MKICHISQIIGIAKKYFTFWFTIPLLLPFSKVVTRKHKGRIIGFLIYSFKKIHFLAVEKKHRKKGYGKSMILQVMKKVKYLHVEPKNRKAIRFYKMMGFKKRKIINSLAGKRMEMEIAAC